jgi:maleate isomerase
VKGENRMFEELLPKKRIGYIYPRWEVDSLPYELYHVLPDRIMVVICPVGLREFTPEDVERALAPVDRYIKALVDREVDIIVHGGVPLDLLQGMKKHDELLARIEKTTGLPATSTIVTILKAHKHMGIKKVAFVNKWSPDMNKSLARYFERDGIQVVGTNTQGIKMEDILKMKIDDNTNLLYDLAREAFKKFPDVDGLYIGGGSMISYPIVDPLEKEFGKPVIINVASLSWTLCHQLDCWTPIHGKGRLLESM